MDAEAVAARLRLNRETLARFCEKWKISELALFGSVLRDDFGPGSDVDILVTFTPDATWTLWDFSSVQSELAGIVGRTVDLVEKKAIRNPFIRREVIRTQVVIYAA